MSPEKGDGGGQPEDDEPEGEPAEGGVRGSVTEKTGMVGEKVGAVKESVPTRRRRSSRSPDSGSWPRWRPSGR